MISEVLLWFSLFVLPASQVPVKVVSPGGKDAPLKAASIVKYSGLLSICNLERVFLVSVYAFQIVKLLKVFLFYKRFVTNI